MSDKQCTIGKEVKLKGIGLHKGARASSIAPDHHNLIVVGAADVSMRAAARRTAERLVPEHGAELVGIASGTVQSVTRGILGTAIIQAFLAGIGLIAAGVPASVMKMSTSARDPLRAKAVAPILVWSTMMHDSRATRRMIPAAGYWSR